MYTPCTAVVTWDRKCMYYGYIPGKVYIYIVTRTRSLLFNVGLLVGVNIPVGVC